MVTLPIKNESNYIIIFLVLFMYVKGQHINDDSSESIYDEPPIMGATQPDNIINSDERMHAEFGDAQHRGYKWYDDKSSSGSGSDSKISKPFSDGSDISSDHYKVESMSSDASSRETKEAKKKSRKWRQCTPCPVDMLKRHRNLGILWICGGYQRARRTFKSACMMRYRNCQDGTMFVKLYEGKCKNDTHHGKHWFYIYHT